MENKTIMDLTAQIVASAAGKTEMGKDEIIAMIKEVSSELRAIENPVVEVVEVAPVVPEKPKNPMSSIKTNEVICLICGTGGFKTLTKHLRQAHQIEPKEYRKQFGIKAGVSLTAKSYVAKRKEIAANSNNNANLEKARIARQANIVAKQAALAKSTKKAAPAKATAVATAPVKKAATKKAPAKAKAQAQEVVVVPE